MRIEYTIESLLETFPDAQIIGEARPLLTGLSSLQDATESDLSFLSNPKYRKQLKESRAGAILVPADLDFEPSPKQVYIKVANPSAAVARICKNIEDQMRPRPPAGVHPTAVIADSAVVAPSASIGAFCVVGEGSIVEENVTLHSHVTLGAGVRVGEGALLYPRCVVQDYCQLGKNVILQPGVVIGSDGFGYEQVGELPNLVHQKIPQVGIVVIEDDVEIGANSTIDRARFGETRIGKGTKIDNLVQIAHNVQIGRGCILCAQVGVSGSSTLGNYVVLWGQAGIAGHIHLGDGAFVGAQAGVSKDVPARAKVSGTPARDLLDVRRGEALLRKLPERIAALESQLKAKGD